MSMRPAGDGASSRERQPGTDVAPIVVERGGDDVRALLDRVGLPQDGRPVIVVAGGADEFGDERSAAVQSMLGTALRFAVAHTGAVIVDGGTESGVMALLGAERGRDPAAMPILLGVAPAGKIKGPGTSDGLALAAHHSHFVLADSDEWGGETSLMANLADALADKNSVVMVVVGGSEGALREAREASARGWPLFVVSGTGGLADALGASARDARIVGSLAVRAAMLRLRRGRAVIALDHGDIRVCHADDPRALGRSMAWELQDEPALKQAWMMFATYDHLAVRSRSTFERYQRFILIMGVVTTAVALAHQAVTGPLRDLLHWGAVALPITISVLIALANRRGAGKRWVLLRGAAEAVKSEMYRYRTRTGVYASYAVDPGDPLAVRLRLVDRLGQIETGLVYSDAAGGSLLPYDGPLPPRMYGAEMHDDGLSRVDAAGYVAMRVRDQLAFYRAKVGRLDRERARLQLLTLVAGAVGALLAAAGAETWIALTTVVAGAALAQLGYLQIDNIIVAYNQASSQLSSLERDFHAAGDATRDDPEYLDLLVTRGEAILTAELGSWVQQMTDALIQLQNSQAEVAARVESAQIERIADDVGERVTFALEGSPLVNYRGFVSVRLLDMSADAPAPTIDGAAAVVAGRTYELEVGIARERGAEVMASEELAIITGLDAPEVPFEVGIDADSLALRAADRPLVVPANGFGGIRFRLRFGDASDGAVWVRVSQQGRIVQIVELEFRVTEA